VLKETTRIGFLYCPSRRSRRPLRDRFVEVSFRPDTPGRAQIISHEIYVLIIVAPHNRGCQIGPTHHQLQRNKHCLLSAPKGVSFRPRESAAGPMKKAAKKFKGVRREARQKIAELEMARWKATRCRPCGPRVLQFRATPARPGARIGHPFQMGIRSVAELPSPPPNAVLARLRHNIRSHSEFGNQVQYAVDRLLVADPPGQFPVLLCLGQGLDEELLAIHSQVTD
jgi:hypothetical protein